MSAYTHTCNNKQAKLFVYTYSILDFTVLTKYQDNQSTWQSSMSDQTPWGGFAFVCKVGQKEVHSCEYVKQSLFLYY